MKFIKCWLLTVCVIMGSLNLRAQEIDLKKLEENVATLEIELEKYSTKQNKMNEQTNELATVISDLKEKESLNYFQRRRLETYLKSSQELSEQIEQVDEHINAIKRELDEKRKQLIELHDNMIDKIVKKLKNDKLTETKKNSLMNELGEEKQKRDLLQAKLDLGIRYPLKVTQIALEEDDTPRQIKEKADLLVDIEKRLRQDADKMQHIISNLKDEIEIREKMTELAHDVSMFSHRDEAVSQQLSTAGAANGRIGYEDYSQNAFLQEKNLSRSSILPLFPEISIEKDVTKLSDEDIQTYIKGLQLKKIQMIQTADSLDLKAKIFYKKADAAKTIKRQD